MTREITEQRRLEHELRRSMAEMQAAHRELDAARAMPSCAPAPTR